MSHQHHCRDRRVVVQKPSTPAYQAARALESNHTGAVVVQEAGHVVGIVTDRDLALRVSKGEIDDVRSQLPSSMKDIFGRDIWFAAPSPA